MSNIINIWQKKLDTDYIPKIHFDDNPILVSLLESMGFKKFGPVHSCHNGYDLNFANRRFGFYDNREYGDRRIEFKVIDYSNHFVFDEVILGLYTKKDIGPRYDLLNLYFDRFHKFSKAQISILIEVGKSIKV